MAYIKSSRPAGYKLVQEITTVSSDLNPLKNYKTTLMKTYDHSHSLTIAPVPSNRGKTSQTTERKEIIFIDQGVDDYPMLITGTRPGIEIHMIDSTQDGVLQITGILKQQRDIDAVHIVSHGDMGYLALGNGVLSTNTLNHYQNALFSWQQALKNNADILIYGCNVGKGSIGQYFIQQLAHITGTNIAASSNLTGNDELGGDWRLDVLTNAIASTHAFYDENLKHYPSTLISNTLDFSNDTVTDYVTATHPTASFGTINFKIVKDINSTGTANASLTLAETGQVSDSYDDFYYTGSDGEYLVIYTDGREVDFQSVKFGSLGATVYTGLTIYAYQDGSLLGSQTFFPAGANFPNHSSSITPELVTFSSSIFDNADEIRLIGANNFGDDVGGSLIDDLVIADPVPPNATPSLAISNDNLTYTENAAAVQIDATATVSDTDGDADWNGGKLEVQITANNEAADRITISDTDGDGTAITVSGTNIFANGTDIGDLSASGGVVTNGTKLTITFDADATNAYVQEVLQSIRYDNTSDNPGAANRTLTFTAIDKNSASASDTRTVAITAVNDAPTMTATPATPTFTEGGSAASLFAGTAISAVESGDTITSLVLTVTNVNDGSNEILSIDGSNVSLTNGNSVATATNAMTADVSLTGSTATVTISKAGGITPAAAQTLINAITYSNTSQDPSTQNRVITLTSIKDSGGTTNGGTDTTSLAIASTVTVASVNDAPILTATGNSPTFTQGGAAVDLFNGVAASTIESGQTLEQLIITVTNVTDGAGANEHLTVDGQNIALSDANSGSTVANGIGYSVALVAGTATLTLTKAGMSSTDVQTLVDGLAYTNSSTPPSSANRVVTITSLQDSGGTANGGLDSATLSLTSTVTVVPNPLISSATYDAATGVLVATGTRIQANGGGADIDASKLTFTGEGGATYTLTDSSDVERDSSTQFTVTLSANDKAALNQILNKSGLASNSGTTYNLAAADDWNTLITDGDTSDNINGITVSNVAAPTITSSTYDASTGALVVTGTNFLQASGATNDIDVSKFTITGEGGANYTLTDTADVEIASGTSFTVMLSATDKASVNLILNKNGTTSTDISTYLLAAAEDWAIGADASIDIEDTFNNITVSNVAAPTITSATYDASTGSLVITGSGFLSRAGVTNDIVASKFTFTGEGGATYTLTDTADVEITSGTSFTLNLSATDKAAINLIINKNGTASTSGTTYNLAAAEDWAAGADAAVAVADLTGNGITASNIAIPTITSATYDADTGALVVTGTNLPQANGATNDIVASKFTLTGEGGATYTLTDSANVEITSAKSFTLSLSATDKTAINQIINKNGTSSTGGTTYNLAAAEDWAAGADAAVNVSDLTGNGITASHVAIPTISSAAYDADTSMLVVTGTNFLQASGAANDIDVSKFTITGEGGATYTLTDTADVEITSGTSFTVALSSNDKSAINQIINKNGTSSTGGTTYNFAAAEDWAAGADAAAAVADLTGNGITASHVAAPTISSAAYDADTGALVVTGTGFLQASGAANDIIASKFTFTGEGGATYALTDTADVEITSGTSFTLNLSATDRVAINQIINKNGTSSTGGTTYNLAAAEDWAAGADAAVAVSDLTDNGITVSNVAMPSITSSTYDANAGILVVTGANLQTHVGETDIDVSKLTLTGEGGVNYTLTDSADVELDSSTQFTVTLSATDKTALNQIINNNGLISTGGTTYNLAAADDWNTYVTDGDTSDESSDITVSNVAAPTITSSTYNASTGLLVVTGENFLSFAGAANDIDVSKLSFTGEGGASHTLTDTSDVEITSDTSFSVTLSVTDRATVNAIINKSGTSSNDGTPYNLAAVEDWAAGADTTVTIADLAGNGITATVPDSSPGKGGGSSGSGGGGGSSGSSGGVTPPSNRPTTSLIDGLKVTKTVKSDGSVIVTAPIVESTRNDDPTSLFDFHADIPIVSNSRGNPILTVSIPVGVGLTSEGQSKPLTKEKGINDLIQRIDQQTTLGDIQRQDMKTHGQNFLDSLSSNEKVSVHTIEFVASENQNSQGPIIINGSKKPNENKQLLIIDASKLPADTILQLNDVGFAVVIGKVRIAGGDGKNFVTSDHHDQIIILGAEDDILFGGDGNDTVGSLSGEDHTSGDAGNDIVYGGAMNDTLSGGTGDDQLNGGLGFDTAIQEGELSDYVFEINGHELILTQNNGETDILTDVELIRFGGGPTLAVAHSEAEAAAHHLVKTWLERDLTAAEGNAVQNWRDANVDDIAAAFLTLPEATDLRDKTNTELLASLDNNPNILRLDVNREFVGTVENDQGYLPLGLALNADGGMGHDVLHMRGNRNDVHLEFSGDVLELTRLEDGAMLGLKNAEAIAFDSGEIVVLAHDSTEAILARLFHSFFNRDATPAEWQLGREALAAQISPDIILDWFKENADLDSLSNTDYIQTLYQHTFNRQANENELNEHLYRIDNDQVDREWLAVEVASSAEAVNLIGNVIVHEGWI